MSEIKNRSELVFLYDIKDANPNGDPLDENKPRIDEETGINLVTDVRLKRTIRDYLHDFKNEDIFVREIIYDTEGHIQDAKLRARDFVESISNKDTSQNDTINKFKSGDKIDQKDIGIIKDNIRSNVIRKAIDIRLFGATIPLEFDPKEFIKKPKNPIKSSITLTGPIQFKIGRSLHKVESKHFRGTGAFASKKGAGQKTFREEDFLPYSLICFYGIINENAAKDTKLTEDDVKLLLDGMWDGTKNLISRSKAGQVPRLLLKVNYIEDNYHIGDLNSMLKLLSDVPEREIRDISQFKIDITELIDTLSGNKAMIQNIEYRIDDRLNLLYDEKKCTIAKCFEKIGIATKQI